MVILQLLKGFSYLIGALVVVGLLKDLHSYLYWRLKYKNQGIRFEYIPIIGMIYYVLVGLHPIFEKRGGLKAFMPDFYTKSDPVAKWSQLFEKTKDQKVIAINHLGLYPFLLFQNVELVQDILI